MPDPVVHVEKAIGGSTETGPVLEARLVERERFRRTIEVADYGGTWVLKLTFTEADELRQALTELLDFAVERGMLMRPNS